MLCCSDMIETRYMELLLWDQNVFGQCLMWNISVNSINAGMSRERIEALVFTEQNLTRCIQH